MNGRNKELLLISILMLVAIYPDLVLAGFSFTSTGGDSIAGVLEKIFDIMTGRVAKTLAMITICGCGYLALAGRLAGQRVLYIALGIGIIFGASGIGELLIGG